MENVSAKVVMDAHHKYKFNGTRSSRGGYFFVVVTSQINTNAHIHDMHRDIKIIYYALVRVVKRNNDVVVTINTYDFTMLNSIGEYHICEAPIHILPYSLQCVVRLQ